MMKYLFYGIIIFCLSSCGGKSYSFMADHIFASYGKEMKKKRGYLVEGTGGSIPNENVKSLFISFLGEYEVDIPEARRLYIEVIEGMIYKVNNDKIIRPYLHDYPVTTKNMEVLLSFINRNHKAVAPPLIAFVFCYDGIIHYDIYDKNTPEFRSIYQEPYEVALKIVQDEQQALQVP